MEVLEDQFISVDLEVFVKFMEMLILFKEVPILFEVLEEYEQELLFLKLVQAIFVKF